MDSGSHAVSLHLGLWGEGRNVFAGMCFAGLSANGRVRILHDGTERSGGNPQTLHKPQHHLPVMTKAQRYLLLIDSPKRQHTSLWTQACVANAWPRNDREFRLQKLSGALGRQLTSTSDLINNADIDQVFDFLRAAADDIDAARAVDHPAMGRARRLVFKVREVESCLAGYPARDPMGVEGVRRLVRSLCADIANKGKSVRVEIMDVEDLSAEPIQFTRDGKPRKIPSQLDQLLITLTRMLSKFKGEAALNRFGQPVEEVEEPF